MENTHRVRTWSPEFIEARRRSVSLPHDFTQDLVGIRGPPVLLIHGRVRPSGALVEGLPGHLCRD
jgi:hypothetical protein